MSSDEQLHLRRKEATRKWQLRVLREALMVYGSKCDVCDINDVRMLQWHHREGKINSEIPLRNTRWEELSYIAIIKKRVAEIQLLCANHHIIADIKDNTGRRIGLRLQIWLEDNDGR